ncbi:MAG: hypothetical protein IJA82_03470 [Clostridia bacterium]|nr:hypothetical protein [Clostridia bacterium]
MKRLRLPLLYLLSFVLSIGPIAIFVAFNIDSYVSTTYEAIKLSLGGIMVAIILILKVLGKLKIPSRVVVFSFVLVLSYLLNSLIMDLCILSFLALVGEFFDLVLGIFIKREKEKHTNEKIAKQTVNQLERLMPRA